MLVYNCFTVLLFTTISTTAAEKHITLLSQRMEYFSTLREPFTSSMWCCWGGVVLFYFLNTNKQSSSALQKSRSGCLGKVQQKRPIKVILFSHWKIIYYVYCITIFVRIFSFLSPRTLLLKNI